MNIPIWPSNMEILSQDMQNAFNLVNGDFQSLINALFYSNNATVILSGLQVQANTTPDGGVLVTAGVAVQNGQIISITTNQQANVISGSYAWGTPQTADTTNPRIDLIVCQYNTQTSNIQNRQFKDPVTGVVTNSNVALNQQDYFSINVIHGTPSSSPVAPSVPAGWFALGQVYVAANATTIQQANITDLTSQYRTSGGWLKKVSGNRIWVNDNQPAEIDSTSGLKFFIGNTAYLFDNAASGYLDILGNNSGIRLLSALLANQGITIPPGQTFTNNGSYAGSPIVTSLVGGQNISVTNPTSPGSATVSFTGVLPIANGGTGSSTQNFVDLSTNQTIGGTKTFTNAPVMPQFNGSTGHKHTGASGDAPPIPNTGLTGPLVSSITAGQNISVTNPSGVGAATISLSGTIPSSNLPTNVAYTDKAQTYTQTQTFNGGATIPAGQTFTNNGSYAGSPIVTQINAGTGISVSNPSSPGAATVSVSNAPNSALAGPLVSSVTAGTGISVTNPTGVGSATVNVSNAPNSALAGPLVSSITAGQGISVTNPTGVGAATVSIPNSGITASMLAPGAAVSNIGYTPVNQAGDTMAGELKFTDPQLRGIGVNATFIYGASWRLVSGNLMLATTATSSTILATCRPRKLGRYLYIVVAAAIDNSSATATVSISTDTATVGTFTVGATALTKVFRIDCNSVLLGNSIGWIYLTGYTSNSSYYAGARINEMYWTNGGADAYDFSIAL